MKKNFWVFILLAFFFFSSSQAQQSQQLSEPGNLIDPLEIYQLCKKIASAEFKGRLTGTKEYEQAADWAAEKFAGWGLLPIDKKNGYLQPFPSPNTVIESAEMDLIYPDEKSEQLRLGEDFLPLLFSDSGDHTAEVVFVGWGISAPELGYDDYAGLDVSGKFVLCFRGVPDRSKKEFQFYDEHRTRMKIAKEKGALGLIYIYEEPIANPNGDWIKQFTPAIISEKTADKLFQPKELTSAKLKSDLKLYKKPLSFSLKSKIHFKVHSRHDPSAVGYNIAGYIEGTDPSLKNEFIVFGAHFDHCGEHCGLIFYGAQDNGSGSAVVMALANAFAQSETRPKRSLLFVLFGGEEKGLQGSTYFADHLPDFVKKVDLMLNFDMVGEGAGTNIGYTRESIKSFLQTANSGLNIIRGNWLIKDVGVRSSDYAPFFQKGAPCISFFSDGPHLHYHKIGDTIYRINPDIMGDIARLAYRCALEWANR